jgi:hypothetical protein
MSENGPEKLPARKLQKSFLTVGPTLHYSHTNVQRCWLLALGTFVAVCVFFSRIAFGSCLAFELRGPASNEFWSIGGLLTSGTSIYEYPWQIPVLGLVVGIMAVIPPLLSQLMSFSYSVPLVIVVFFVANLPGFSIFLLISCLAAACRPLRFRSRFIAIALCTAPQLLYWGCFGAVRGLEPIRWGLSFAPWLCAWIAGLSAAAIVLGIGHFTRYRPGLVWAVSAVALLSALVVFERKIGFAELDYQFHVAGCDPAHSPEFSDQRLTKLLDDVVTDPPELLASYISSGFFPTTEPIQLRASLKEEISSQLTHGRWPIWFPVGDELKFDEAKGNLIDGYDLFINRWPNSRRMPIALYFKAILGDYKADIRRFQGQEQLHFYCDYPSKDSLKTWEWLYTGWGDSPEALEARWRMAVHFAGKGNFDSAETYIEQALSKVRDRLDQALAPSDRASNGIFRLPAETVMTRSRLRDLGTRLDYLALLIGPENRAGDDRSRARLAEYVLLDPKLPDFAGKIEQLLARTDRKDPLRDNLLLSRAKLTADEHLRVERLADVQRQYRDTDGGMQALYEIGLLEISFWRGLGGEETDRKKQQLARTRSVLSSFLDLYPDSIFAQQVRKNLDDLPALD